MLKEECEDGADLRERDPAEGSDPSMGVARKSGDKPGQKTERKVKISGKEYEELKSKSAQADEYYDSYLRAMAEFDNFRKRAAKEREAVSLFAIEEVAVDFLNVLDNLERALAASDSSGDLDSLHKGVEITLKDAVQVLEKWGICEVPALGEKFDPDTHEAFMTVDCASPDEDEKVVEVLRKGYRLKEKLIRPSLVKVARRNDNGKDNRN